MSHLPSERTYSSGSFSLRPLSNTDSTVKIFFSKSDILEKIFTPAVSSGISKHHKENHIDDQISLCQPCFAADMRNACEVSLGTIKFGYFILPFGIVMEKRHRESPFNALSSSSILTGSPNITSKRNFSKPALQ